MIEQSARKIRDLESIKEPRFGARDKINQGVRRKDAVRYSKVHTPYITGIQKLASGDEVDKDIWGTKKNFGLWKDSAGEYNMKIDNLFITGTLWAYEFILVQFRAVNGITFFGSGAKVKDIDSTSGSLTHDAYIQFELEDGTDAHPFAVNDAIAMKTVDVESQNVIAKSRMYVKDISPAEYGGKTGWIEVSLYSTDGLPNIGDVVIRIGNSTDSDRQGGVMIVGDFIDEGDVVLEAPYMDVYDGVTDHDEWAKIFDTLASEGGTNDKTKVRVGKLDGLGGLHVGYGMYGTNIYLEGNVEGQATILYGTANERNAYDASLLVDGTIWVTTDDENNQWQWMDNAGSKTSGSLGVGVMYDIDTYVAGDDFDNVATVISGTINTTGCVFRATGNTPDDWTHGSTITYGAWINVVDDTIPTDKLGKIVMPVAPSGAGLYLSSTYMGFYDGGAWRSFFDNSGNMQLGASGGNVFSFNQSSNIVTISSSVSGQRIEISGANNQLSFYDSGNNEIVKIGDNVYGNIDGILLSNGVIGIANTTTPGISILLQGTNNNNVGIYSYCHGGYGANDGNIGVDARVTTPGPNTPGQNTGIIGSASGATVNYAGVFLDGNVLIQNTLYVNDIDVDGSITMDAGETVDGVDISALNVIVGGVTEAEMNQIENIGAYTISATQWSYLGGFDQNLRKADNVEFNSFETGVLTLTNQLRMNEADTYATAQGMKFGTANPAWLWQDAADSLKTDAKFRAESFNANGNLGISVDLQFTADVGDVDEVNVDGGIITGYHVRT